LNALVAEAYDASVAMRQP